MNFANICIISSLITVLIVLPPLLMLVSIFAGIRPGMLLPLLVAMFAICCSSFASNAWSFCVWRTTISKACLCVSSCSLVWSSIASNCSFCYMMAGLVFFIWISVLKWVLILGHVVEVDLFQSRHASLRLMYFWTLHMYCVLRLHLLLSLWVPLVVVFCRWFSCTSVVWYGLDCILLWGVLLPSKFLGSCPPVGGSCPTCVDILPLGWL